MKCSSPPTIPYSPDPALFLHSEIDGTSVTDTESLDNFPQQYSNHSDELEALQLQKEEVTAEKNRQGLVIQHRAWRLAEAFRSDELYNTASPSKKISKFKDEDELIPLLESSEAFPSSPPGTTMVLGMPTVMHTLGSSSAAVTKTSKPSFFDALRGKKATSENGPSLNAIVSDIRTPHAVTNQPQKEVPEESRASQHASISRAGPFLVDEDDSNEDAETTKQNEISKMGTSSEETFSNDAQIPFYLPSSSAARSLGSNKRSYAIKTCSGKNFTVQAKSTSSPISYKQLVAARSVTTTGRAQKSYYGIDIHKLLDDHAKEIKLSNEQAARIQAEIPQPSIEPVAAPRPNYCGKTLLWTEKYRAKTFTDLIGDERTHRSVLKWLKGWDPIVFPHHSRTKVTTKGPRDGEEDQRHRKVLLLTGQAGLGKTTLAHVAARQAGYEVIEINGSDERSAKVVQGRIRDSLGTENVRSLGGKSANGKFRKAGKPVCLVVDEVDGAVVGSSGGAGVGDGGFIKALMDLVALDQKNSSPIPGAGASTTTRKKKKNEKFRIMRPIILICNDVYHPSLRPLRQSGVAEIVHVRKPPLNMVVSRMKAIFEKEGFPCDCDGVRRLCEATWGLSNRKDAGSGSSGSAEGDIRGVMVIGEWVAGKLRCSPSGPPRLTRRWVEAHVCGDLNHGGTVARGLGRGGNKEIVERVFLEGAGFPKTSTLEPTDGIEGEGSTKVGVAEIRKRMAMDKLREMVDTGGECERVITDCFSTYPSQPYQDDTLLSKPSAAHEWLHFYDTLSSRVFQGQEWELTPYLSQPVLSFHHLFASSARYSHASNSGYTKFNEEYDVEPLPFTGTRADFAAHEAEKHNRALLLSVQSALSIQLLRSFRSPGQIATDLVPYLNLILTPDVKPVVVGGSGDQRGVASVRKENERAMVRRAVRVMSGVGVTFERGRMEEIGGRDGGWIYRMEPPIDVLATCETASKSLAGATAPIRYAVRQVLHQEYQKDIIRQRSDAAQARYRAGGLDTRTIGPSKSKKEDTDPNPGKTKVAGAKRDFFGRVIVNDARPCSSSGDVDELDGSRKRRKPSDVAKENTVWVSFHEGFSNAVRKPISLEEFLRGL